MGPNDQDHRNAATKKTLQDSESFNHDRSVLLLIPLLLGRETLPLPHTMSLSELKRILYQRYEYLSLLTQANPQLSFLSLILFRYPSFEPVLHRLVNAIYPHGLVQWDYNTWPREYRDMVWSYEITDDPVDEAMDSDLRTYCMLSNVPDLGVITLRNVRDVVGPNMPLPTLTAQFRYNAGLRAKVGRMHSAYSGWRSIRGDGNCYYR